jgi:hypothetical protein
LEDASVYRCLGSNSQQPPLECARRARSRGGSVTNVTPPENGLSLTIKAMVNTGSLRVQCSPSLWRLFSRALAFTPLGNSMVGHSWGQTVPRIVREGLFSYRGLCSPCWRTTARNTAPLQETNAKAHKQGDPYIFHWFVDQIQAGNGILRPRAEGWSSEIEKKKSTAVHRNNKK